MVGLVTNLAGTSNITLQKYLPIGELSKRFFFHALPFFQVVNACVSVISTVVAIKPRSRGGTQSAQTIIDFGIFFVPSRLRGKIQDWA